MSKQEGRKGRRGSAGTRASISAGGDPAQLLPQAVNAHHTGNLARARVLYEQVLANHPEHSDALQYLGILCHQEGDAARAEALIRRAIAIMPGVGIYHDNLGTVLEAAGRIEEAQAEYRTAEELDGREPERDYNLGVVMQRLGRHQEAVGRFRSALSIAPEDAAILFGLATALRDAGNPDEAELLYRQILSRDPAHQRARLNLGNLLQNAGRLEEAEQELHTLLNQDPGHAGALHNLGMVLRKRGDLPAALDRFQAALDSDPGLHSASLGRAELLELQGHMDEAMVVYRALLEVPEMRVEARRAMLRVLSVWAPDAADESLMAFMYEALQSGEGLAGALARAGFTQLIKRYGLASALEGPALAGAARALCDDPLCLVLLARTVNVVPEMERWMSHARSAALADPALRGPLIPLLGAIAMQCRLNEFVAQWREGDAAALSALQQDLSATRRDGRTDLAVQAVLTFACFSELSELEQVDEAALRSLEAPEVERLLVMDMEQPRSEHRLLAEIESLGTISDPVSSSVRQQYEDNPYPRWSELPPASQRPLFTTVLRDQVPRHVARLSERELSILVAGCGTGQEALCVAAAMPDAHITALDLSLASLAYARRMADALHRSVTFLHGDLLDIARLDRRFHVITASGVLHHMADPQAGWHALLQVLEEDGLMKVALYSHLARALIRVARERIEALGLAPERDGVCTLRRRVLEGSEPGLRGLLDSEDFYSVSSCRDLLFHPVEHHYSLPQLATTLEQLGLEFLGFELPHALLRQQFLSQHPGALRDLGAWHEFEQRHPDTFGAMYVFWCRRAARQGDRSWSEPLRPPARFPPTSAPPSPPRND